MLQEASRVDGRTPDSACLGETTPRTVSHRGRAPTRAFSACPVTRTGFKGIAGHQKARKEAQLTCSLPGPRLHRTLSTWVQPRECSQWPSPGHSGALAHDQARAQAHTHTRTRMNSSVCRSPRGRFLPEQIQRRRHVAPHPGEKRATSEF